MAGKIGRSGRRPQNVEVLMDDNSFRAQFIVNQYFKDPAISLSEKVVHAMKLVLKYMPEKIESRMLLAVSLDNSLASELVQLSHNNLSMRSRLMNATATIRDASRLPSPVDPMRVTSDSPEDKPAPAPVDNAPLPNALRPAQPAESAEPAEVECPQKAEIGGGMPGSSSSSPSHAALENQASKAQSSTNPPGPAASKQPQYTTELGQAGQEAIQAKPSSPANAIPE